MATATPARAETLRFSFQGDIGTMDPQALRQTFTTEFLANIMEPLVRYDEHLEPEPALAERWERVSPIRWRFFLRKGVRFSNGSPFAADDVIVTYQRGSHPDSPMRGNISGLKAIHKVDGHTVEIETHGEYPLVLRELTAMLIFDREWLEEHDATEPTDPGKSREGYLARHILGTGPFVLKSYEPDTRCVLVANPDWWDDANKVHNLTRVEFHPIRSDATRVAALLSGQMDMIFPCPLQDIKRIESSPGLRVLEKPSLRTLHLGMNVESEELAGSNIKGRNPLRDRRVRQAIYQAIDIDAIVARLMRGHAEPASVIMPPAIKSYDRRLDGRLPHDLAKARRLLSEAGYAEGFSLRLDCPNDRYVNDEELCVALAGMLAKIGVKVSLRAQTKSRFQQTILGGQPDLYMFGWAAADTMDAHSFLKDLIHTREGAKGAFNVGGYSNARVDAFEPLVASEPGGAKRRELVYEAFQIHKDEIGHVPLHIQHVVWGVRDGVELFQPPIDAVWLRFFKVR